MSRSVAMTWSIFISAFLVGAETAKVQPRLRFGQQPQMAQHVIVLPTRTTDFHRLHMATLSGGQ
jgi:hypothetical protein